MILDMMNLPVITNFIDHAHVLYVSESRRNSVLSEQSYSAVQSSTPTDTEASVGAKYRLMPFSQILI